MATYLDIGGDPHEVAAAGAMLRSIADTLHRTLAEPLAQIRAIEAERPWGADEYGQAFEATYHYQADGDEVPLRTGLQDGMAHAGEVLGRVGERTVRAMSEYHGIDVENARDIGGASDL